MSGTSPPPSACVLLYTKPARAGRVKTRLIGELSAVAAAELHAAFLGDLVERLRRGRFELRLAWALEPGEEPEQAAAGLPLTGIEGFRQEGEGLGTRLFRGLRRAAERFELVAAVGSDHPELDCETVEDGFVRLARGTDVVLGPTPDGGYYLIGLRRRALRRELFEGIRWSTSAVLPETRSRCRRLGLRVELLPEGFDIDFAEDLRRLERRLSAAGDAGPPRTRSLLASWGRLPVPTDPETGPHHWRSRSEAETERVGAELARRFGPDGVLLLVGELGTGKTVLVRGMAGALGVDRREIQSPTFTLIHEHEGEHGRLVHVDLYRLEPREVESLGLEELLAGPGVKAIEWADRLPSSPPGAVRVDIRRRPGGGREIRAEPREALG